HLVGLQSAVPNRRRTHPAYGQSMPYVYAGVCGWRGASSGHLTQLDRPLHVEAKAAAAGVLNAQEVATFLEPPAQQDQSRLEVVLDVGEVQKRIEADLLVRNLDPLLLRERLEQTPEHASGDALDHVLVADEDAVVERVVLHLRQVAPRR